MKDITQAVILCGGLGTRLRPITNSLPKPMVVINKKPFLWYLLLKLSSPPNNIKKFLLLTGYLEEKIKNYFRDGKEFGWEISYSSGPSHWETGRRIWEANEHLDEQFVLCYSDNFAQVNLSMLYQIWEKNSSSITLLIAKKKIGNVMFKENSKNILYSKERKENYQYVELGFMICSRSDIFRQFKIIQNSPNINLSEILEKLSLDNRLSGFIINDPYHSIGDLKRLEKTREYFKQKRILLLDRDGVINVKAPRGKYITSWENFTFIQDTIEALEKLSLHDFKFIIISNQAGIATGEIENRNLEEIHDKMTAFLKTKGVRILDIFVSKDHWKSQSFRRKPNPGMFFEVSQKYLLRLDETFYIGDDPRDCEAARNASCRSILIGDNIDKTKCTPDYYATRLTDILPSILEKFIERENKFNPKSC